MIIGSARARAATTVGVLAAYVWVGAAGSPGAQDRSTAEHPAAAATVLALGSGDTDTASAAFPPDFETAMRYSPIREPGVSGERLSDPQGSCSSPVPLPALFEPACRTHDLGYDLLRFARDSGGELGPDARRALDRNLTRDLREACATEPDAAPGCVIAAEVASVAVRINSWRQQYRAPSPESPLPILLGLGTAATAGAAGLRVRS
ncbi:phospholipase [Rhodococcus sp. HM1]|uniref:hypothetical protein n=1 Tax=unclassified Rhodococcus (in: high G+C Gram-positive bacteria) TaxID=192944 RepID=UPI0018CD3F12|nr:MULTISPECIES: hypothetical protein [unclassified Rhodococcus (in: high G+C Gram-positive bacteria)]MBH0123434.1 hypothetical protein [Rhodococcus sp. CX]MCK8670240.1 phospholipase [Rhodococcus sp. HM1]